MSKSSALPIDVLLIFEMQLINCSLFLKANFLSYAALFRFSTIIVSSTTKYAYCNPKGLIVTLMF